MATASDVRHEVEGAEERVAETDTVQVCHEKGEPEAHGHADDQVLERVAHHLPERRVGEEAAVIVEPD
jgi:hypothetical protein